MSRPLGRDELDLERGPDDTAFPDGLPGASTALDGLPTESRARAIEAWDARDRSLRAALDEARCSLGAEVALFLDGNTHRLDRLKRVSEQERAARDAWLANAHPDGDA